MSALTDTKCTLVQEPPEWLQRPRIKLQPVLAKEGKTNIDLEALARDIRDLASLAAPIAIKSPAHWAKAIQGLGKNIDAIIPVSITAYPTEVWNSHPDPLVKRGLPVLFWPIIEYDEPDFWRWSARDFLCALGVDAKLVKSKRHGLALLRALAMKRFLKKSKLVVIGKQNFPWNAPAAGHFVTKNLGTKIKVHTLASVRKRAKAFTAKKVESVWQSRQSRYENVCCKDEALQEAVRTYLGVKALCEDEKALGFGVNCFGELVIEGGRDVPCLAQTLLREDGFVASCDGDYLAMMCMVLTTFFLDKPCMMSNMYPIQYVGALKDHFGDPLSPREDVFPRATRENLARLGHCGFVGVVSPEMDPSGKVRLHDWGGTYEIKRDGRGCGIDGDLAAGEPFTAIQLKFDGKTLIVGSGQVIETTRHPNMPHCESTALLEFHDLEGFVDNISREHSVVVYGDHVQDYEALGEVLGLDVKVY